MSVPVLDRAGIQDGRTWRQNPGEEEEGNGIHKVTNRGGVIALGCLEETLTRDTKRSLALRGVGGCCSRLRSMRLLLLLLLLGEAHLAVSGVGRVMRQEVGLAMEGGTFVRGSDMFMFGARVMMGGGGVRWGGAGVGV